MAFQYYKSFTTLSEQLHEEEVLYNEATRMHALPNVLQEIKNLILKHKEELGKQDYFTSMMSQYYEEQSSLLNV